MMGIFLLAGGFFVWATMIVASLLRRDEACRPPHTCDDCGAPAPIITKTGRRLCIDCATGKKCEDAEETLWYRGER